MLRSTALLAASTLLVGTASAQLGSNYCMANANSTGSISLISAAGSLVVSDNDVTLSCDSLPLNSFGYFITSQTQGFVANPAGSAGNICVGGSIGRYAGNVLNSGATGSVSMMVDLTSVPEPTMNYAVMPGDTVNFQYWHRDGSFMGPTSNFSEGLEIQFIGAGAPTFAADVYPLLTQPNINAPACVVCHGGTCSLELGPDAATAFNNLVNKPSLCCGPTVYVVPNDPANSLLYQKLTAPSCGGQMPQGGTFAGDPQVIFDWISAGAPF